jgi:MFS family permease
LNSTVNKFRLSPTALLIVLTGLNLLNYLDRYVLSAILTPLKEDLQLTDGELGRVSTAFMLGYFLISPLFGYLGDRISRKWLIAGGVFIWSLGTVLSGFATGLGTLLIYRLLVGFGEASYGAISPALISDSFSPAKRNNAMTIFFVAIPVGSALGYILGGQVASAHGWREAFIWAGAPGLVLALLLLPFPEPKRGESDGLHQSAHRIPAFRDVLSIFKIREFIYIVAGYCAYAFALGAYAYWGPTFLHRIHGMPNEKAATFFGAVTVVAGLLGTLIGGFAATALQKKFRAGYAFVLAFATLASVPLSIVAFTSADSTIVSACLAIAIFLIFLPTGPINTLIIESVPINLRASGMALSIFCIHMFGDMWSPEIVGRLADRWNSLQSALLILPTFFAIAGFIWLAYAIRILKRPVKFLT